MSRRFCTFAAEKRLSAVSLQQTKLMADSYYHFKTMVTELLVVWIVGVVSFFVLWALLAKVIKRISEKKQKADTPTDEADKNSAPESFPSEG